MGTTFFAFFIILLVAVVFSQFFSRMRVPWVVALVVGGIVVGPSGFGLFEVDATINFFAVIGLVFLMFMAGLESRLSSAKGIKRQLVLTPIFIGVFPTLIGIWITLAFGYSWTTAVLVGIVFMSSSISLLLPQFQAQKIIASDLGRVIIGSIIIVDAFSLLFLAIFLQYVGDGIVPVTILMYLILAGVVAAMLWFAPKMRWLAFAEDYPEQQDLYEKELRFIILVLVGFVVFFELAGLHAIIAAFFAGLVLSGTIKSHLTKAKLHAIGYGFFIPVFFVVLGATIDVSIFVGETRAILLTASITGGLILSKFFGGVLAGKIGGFTNEESVFLGTSTIPQLSTVLAVAFLGFGEGILDNNLLASIVALVIITAIVTPIIINILGRNLTSQQVVIKEALEPEKTLSKKPEVVKTDETK